MKILLTGAAGQLGQELQPRLDALGEVLGLDRSPPDEPSAHTRFDLADLGRLEVLLNRFDPDLIVNAAAYTAVDQAEREAEAAFTINAAVPERLARWAKRNDAALLHYSTDYVFDGALGRAYRETDQPAPLNRYGETKHAGEQLVQDSGCRHLVLRSSWIYSAHGNNFVLKMLELARRLPALRVVGDQTGCPTWARNLAGYSMQALHKGLLGRRNPPSRVYHCADRDALSWFDFAGRVFDTATELGILDRPPPMEKVRTDEYPQLARRPHWSVLDCQAARKDLGVQARGLDESLRACLQELIEDD